MRRIAIGLGALALVVVACNALSGIGDLTVCEGAECSDATFADARPNDVAPIPVGDGGPGITEAGAETGGDPCAACPQACLDGACVLYPSCRGANLECGTTKASCCETKPVPGGTFLRANAPAKSATISPYSLDTYEVTVARFRAFVAAGQGIATSPPAAGAGANPHIADSGWKGEWSAQLVSTTTALEDQLVAKGSYTKAPSTFDQQPVTGVSYFEAFAFCAWDGGRLPTLAERSFAGSGGDEQRLFPWSVPPTSDTIDRTKAAYECRYADPKLECPGPLCVGANPPQAGACDALTCADGGGACQNQPCTGCDRMVDLAPVGAIPDGVGRYGQLDLGGNANEILLDAKPKAQPDGLPSPCIDCAPLMAADPKGAGPGGPGGPKQYEWLSMGGDFGDLAGNLTNDTVISHDYRDRFEWMGFRCARDK